MTAAEKLEIVNANTQRRSSYTEKQEAENTYRGKVEVWKQRDANFTKIARLYIREIQGRPETTDAQREIVRIPVRDKEPTPVGIPADGPNISINFAYRNRHIVSAGPDPKNEHRNAKPKGVAFIELRMKVGDLRPSSPEDTVPVAIITHSPYTAELGEHRGKTIWWIARYLNTKGEPGPWSEAVSAQVTGI
ncbi:MAG: hypothetical protein HY769_08595 [Candidatus Stahlbacteria bacterium]|nr:hypothetical protein [Candidatus Stahlbacteria bacterium]